MAPSSVEIVIQNCRISQSETSAGTIRDVVDIIYIEYCPCGAILNYRPSAPSLYKVASHVKSYHFSHIIIIISAINYYYYILLLYC